MFSTRLAVGRYCPGQPNGLSVVLGYGYKVAVKCADADGNFPIEAEPHGQADPTNAFLDGCGSFGDTGLRRDSSWLDVGGVVSRAPGGVRLGCKRTKRGAHPGAGRQPDGSTIDHD